MNPASGLACTLLLFLASTPAWGHANVDGVTLSNDVMTVQLGAHGLTVLQDRTIKKQVAFGSDEFSITLEGITLTNDSAGSARVQKTGSGAVYRYSVRGFDIEIHYELRPGWRFVSKQLKVTRSPSNRCRVDRIEIWRSLLNVPVADFRIAKSTRLRQAPNEYGLFLRLLDRTGVMALVQNPFLETGREANSFRISYAPEMDWKLDDGPFESDRGCIGLYGLTGREIAGSMIPEWKIPDPLAARSPGLDEAEVRAFTDCVKAFLLYQPSKPLRMFVGWCVNDYQIDAATPEGRTEYKRIIDRASEMGAENILYAPTHSGLSRREESADSWHWENLLWLALGQKIRRNEWNPAKDKVPDSVQEMLDYARSRNVRLVAYVYPVMPFSQNPEWLVTANNSQYGNLGFRSLQDFLIEYLTAFKRRAGLGGYAFDYTFLTYPGPGRYIQWWGWKRVLESLRREFPDIVIDGRQSYMNYGPWIWLAGSYPHPTGTDEQPESFVNFPDLHFDRVSANRQRYTAYWYRNYEFCPTEIMPGFITHQTPRSDESGDMPRLNSPGKTGEARPIAPFRQRDWDYMGWRYSLISSIATAGWNNVLNMIPARDMDEYRNFSQSDLKWFRKWLDWADANKEILRHTRFILAEPAIGRIDGTSAILNGKGFIFLFNPNGRKLSAELVLDDSIGFGGNGNVLLKELYPLEGKAIGKPGAGFWRYGDRVSIEIEGAGARVIELSLPGGSGPWLFNSPGSVRLNHGVLELAGIRGEMGSRCDLMVLFKTGQIPQSATLNGSSIELHGKNGLRSIPLKFAGEPFGPMQPLLTHRPDFRGASTERGSFRIPQRIFDQLAARRKAWPIPWTREDYRSTWLAPERLLLQVQIAEPSDKMAVKLRLDGEPVELKKAYSSIHPEDRCFTGFYADLSRLEPGREYRFELELPLLKPGQFQGLFFENIETEYTDQVRTGSKSLGSEICAEDAKTFIVETQRRQRRANY